jgi:hypothetical protein
VTAGEKNSDQQSASPAAKKSLEICERFKRIVGDHGVRVSNVFPIGHKYDSAFWIAVATDAERDRLLNDEALLARLHAVFVETGYQTLIEDIWEKEVHLPALEYLKTLHITFESRETVDRDHGGNWWYAMK